MSLAALGALRDDLREALSQEGATKLHAKARQNLGMTPMLQERLVEARNYLAQALASHSHCMFSSVQENKEKLVTAQE